MKYEGDKDLRMERIGMSDIDGNAARVAGASAGARVTN